MVLPGPEAQQLATYLGWLMHGTWGGLVAGTLFVLPALLMLIGLSWLYMVHGDLPLVAAALAGIKPAVVAIVLQAAWRIGKRTLKSPMLWTACGLALGAVALLHVPFPFVILTAGLAGWAAGRWRPGLFKETVAPQARYAPHVPSLIDDDTPPPAHARYSQARFLRWILVGVLIWFGAFGILRYSFGPEGLLTQISGFFTKVALLTFGGAYAVLPYLYQGAVQGHGWLTPDQMIDGLALGETTPGPLIMIVAYVGFIAGWGHPIWGTDTMLASGVAAACVATLFTFLPSFLFIFIGAPLVEATHDDLRFTAPLRVITAAVVGVMCHLALFLAGHVLFLAKPQHGLLC